MPRRPKTQPVASASSARDGFANHPASDSHASATVDPASDTGGSNKRVSLATVERLTVYRSVLEELHEDGVEFVYSHTLADMVGVTAAQLRRDLASFGSFGNIARGYPVYEMARTIGRILHTDRVQTLALFGVGDLGRSLLSYRGFEERGFRIGVAFDLDPAKVGKVFAGRRCFHLEKLEAVIPDYDVRIALLACRPPGLQRLVDRLGLLGVRSVLNFVPKRVRPAPGGHVEHIDISGKLEMLSFLSNGN